MLISLEWLKEYVDIKEDVKELENALTMIGQEVEAITVQGKDLDRTSSHSQSLVLKWMLNVLFVKEKDAEYVKEAVGLKLWAAEW